MADHSDDTSVRERGYLPHWERSGATYFVTFRLSDALPRSVLDLLDAERKLMQAQFTLGQRDMNEPERPEAAIALAQRIERYLDRGAGTCYLTAPAIASLVADALRHFDGDRYRLLCWCIMPNHVHVIVQPLAGHPLAKVVHSWKFFTAHAANRLLGASGAFWQREYYDYLIRDEVRLFRLVRYVLQNPEKARLVDWPWVYVRNDLPGDVEQNVQA